MARRYDRQMRAAGTSGASIPGAQVTLWDAATGGTQVTTGITLLDGTPVSGGVLTCDGYGYAPALIDTADRVDLWAIGSLSGEILGVARIHLEPTDTDARVASLESMVASLESTVTVGLAGAVATAGGSTVEIPEGDTTTQALAFHLPTGDRSAAPDTVAFYVNVGTGENPVWRRTGFFNEYGMPRVIGVADNQVPLRVKRRSAAQTANIFEITASDNTVLAAAGPDGTLTAPNLGTARATASTTPPAAPRAGDLWSDLSTSPPTVRVYGSGGWLTLGQATIPPPAGAPAFVASTQLYFNGYQWGPSAPVGAGTLVACLAWNTTDPAMAPSGWELVDELITSSARSGVWVAAGDVSDTLWTWDTNKTQPKISGVIVGYESCTVAGHAHASDTDGDAVHTAPDLTVDTAPATVLRAWWDKTSTTTSATMPTGVTSRAEQYGTGGGSCAVVAGDAEQTATGQAGTADATFDDTAGNAGGYTLALVAV